MEEASGQSPLMSRIPFRSSIPSPRLWAQISGLFLAAMTCLLSASATRADSLPRIRDSHKILYGSDAEGGGPFAYPNPSNPREVVGFEVDLMGLLCGALGPEPVFVQGQWDSLLPTLDTGRIDVVVNGYEWTPARAERYLATKPYYIYELQVMAAKGGPVRSFDDLSRPRPDGRKWRVGVLGGSAAETFAISNGRDQIEVLYFNGATDAMMAVKNGQADATLQDLPAARFYKDHFPSLELAGPPIGRGLYVMYLRKGEEALRDALDRGLTRLARNGDLKTLYERYGIWTEIQAELSQESDPSSTETAESAHGLGLIRRYGVTLISAAGMTLLLSFAAMPIAILVGLLVALGRLYGPRWLARLLAVYVEVLRGTPLMLQLYVLYFLLPEVGVELPAMVAGIAGLAINYSAYEAEIYRAGLQAIPVGQMEAALALGMTRPMALRRVIVPQAMRIVIPPVTNDFIALFKDTSVCSVISIVELTKRYSILANSTGGVVEFAALTAVLYLLMSLPLSWFSRWFERRLAAEGPRGGLVG